MAATETAPTTTLPAVPQIVAHDVRPQPSGWTSWITTTDHKRIGILYAGGPVERLPPNGRSLNVCVNGQQYVWRYTYGSDCKRAPLNAAFSYETMVVPTGTTVTLSIQAQDVVHSWWIPQLGGKMDAVPGYTNYTWFKVPTGMEGKTFRGQCAELCGRNHANMVAHVLAVSPSRFEAYLRSKRREVEQADQGAATGRKKLDANPQANP